jgi:hypothetical protein
MPPEYLTVVPNHQVGVHREWFSRWSLAFRISLLAALPAFRVSHQLVIPGSTKLSRSVVFPDSLIARMDRASYYGSRDPTRGE